MAVAPEDQTAPELPSDGLDDHAVWRDEITAGRLHAYAAAGLGRSLGAVGFATSVFGTPGPQRRRRIAEAMTPELSEVTENLVFTEPYVDHAHNSWLPANDDDVRELRTDRIFVREIGLAKQRFQEDTQSFVRGDLHTGAVLVREDGASVRAIDSDFGTYAPTGFDLGAVWANLLIASARASVLGRTADAERLLALPVDLIAAFEEEFTRGWPDRVDPRVFGDDVLAVTLRRIRSDAAVYAAAEAVRRILGYSKVADVEALPEHERALVARRVIDAARTIGVARLIDPDPARLVHLTREPLLS